MEHPESKDGPIGADFARPGAGGANEKIVLLVLGMHRSGTSSLAGAFARLGAKLPTTLLAPTPGNERGYNESERLLLLNEAALARAGTAWDDLRAFDCSRFSPETLEELTERLTTAFLEEFQGAPLCVVKDPRICRMMPLWSRIFERAGYAIRPVVPLRLPLEVAQSLLRREGVPASKGVLLWLRHVLDAEAHTRDLPRAFVEWSAFLSDWRSSLERAYAMIGLDAPRFADAAAADVDSYLTPNLRHNVFSIAEMAADPNVNVWACDAYRALLALTERPYCPDAMHRLDSTRAEFDGASQNFGAAFAELDALGASAAGAAREEAEAQRHRIEALTRERDMATRLAAAARAERDLLFDSTAQARQETVRTRLSLEAKLSATTAERDSLAATAAQQREEIEELAAQRDALRLEREALSAATGRS